MFPLPVHKSLQGMRLGTGDSVASTEFLYELADPASGPTHEA